MVDDFSGYKALFAGGAIREAGCWAHARRKFFEAHKLTGSALAAQALERIGELYRIEQDIRAMDPAERLRRRRQNTQPRLHALHAWLREQRPKLNKADATARAIDYALGRWAALGVFADDSLVPIDNNAAERAVRPIALGRKNWLFVGSRQAGERAAALMTLIESAKLCGLDPRGSSQGRRVPYTAIEPPKQAEVIDAHPDAPSSKQPEAAPRKPGRADFKRGDKVAFVDKYLRRQVGVIARINQLTASIDCDSGESWRVGFHLLRHVIDIWTPSRAPPPVKNGDRWTLTKQRGCTQAPRHTARSEQAPVTISDTFVGPRCNRCTPLRADVAP